MLCPYEKYCSRFLTFASRFLFSRAKQHEPANEVLRMRRKFARCIKCRFYRRYLCAFDAQILFICVAKFQPFI